VEAVWVAGFPHGANHTGTTYIRNWASAAGLLFLPSARMPLLELSPEHLFRLP
jgi:hypothetical protein